MTHCLKQLTEDTIKNKRLLIPGEFVRRCGRGNLTNPVVLEPTVGDAREMELYEDGGGFWLRNGWEELVDRYKLCHGCYLLFEYKSYSRFKLLMLGGNGLDLEFPGSSSPPNVGSNENQEVPEPFEEQDSVDAHSVEILGSSFKEMNNNNQGKRRTEDGGEEREVNQEASRRDRAIGRSPSGRDKDANSRIPSMPEQEDEPAFPRSFSSSKRGRPVTVDAIDEDFAKFTGISWMKNINIHNNNGDGGGRQQAQSLFAENGKHKEFMRTSDKKRRRTTEGGHNMKLNKEAPRRNRAEPPAVGPSSSQRPTTEPVNGCTSEPSFLVVSVSENCLAKSGLGMRGGFVERHITNWNGKMVELQVEQETWPVRIISDNGVPTISKGWWAFARLNSLKVGDTLILAPTTTEDVLTVHILRRS